ncbi:type VII secretion protein EccB [Mycobacterium sp. UM_Kg1]|uniref:type VII secretion protein EccB n=1 Tax=Mycobacterium sp. UM_Kg1 TaxID=1545691 RepID=UPI0009E3179B|nr:type VII secretion protein EccB [Mycobacterium sp. UM_Kg1]
MAGRSGTQLELSAHRFAARRLARALSRGHATGDPAPGRAALGLSWLVSALVAAGAVVLAVVRPQPVLGDEPIVLDRGSGALYVRVADVLHPVYNLASARLIAGAADPLAVDGEAIRRARRGPPLGIPGAPGVLGAATPAAQAWSLCDDTDGTTLIVGRAPRQSAGVTAQEAVPVASESGARYLLVDGRRIAVDPADPVLAAVVSRRVSALLLNAIPEAPAASPVDPRRLRITPATLCAHWRPEAPDAITLSTGAFLSTGEAPTALAQADGPGPALDAVYLPPGHTPYVRAIDTAGHPVGSGYLIADTGVRFAVADDDAARSLGLAGPAAGVPWPLLAGLPAGPRLSREQALRPRDLPSGGPPVGR